MQQVHNKKYDDRTIFNTIFSFLLSIFKGTYLQYTIIKNKSHLLSLNKPCRFNLEYSIYEKKRKINIINY